MEEYLQQVNIDFTILEKSMRDSGKDGTSCKDVLQYLVDTYKEKTWHMSWELTFKTTSKGGYISHRGPARASDLALKNPELVEARKIGRFCAYRVRRENRDKVLEYLK